MKTEKRGEASASTKRSKSVRTDGGAGGSAALEETLASIGVSLDGTAVADPNRLEEVSRVANRVLRGLLRQLGCAQAQRNFLAGREEVYWRWDLLRDEIRFEGADRGRGAAWGWSRVSGWESLIDPSDAEGRAALEGFRAETIPARALSLRMRVRDGGWRQVSWQGRIVERDGQGGAVYAAGIVRLLSGVSATLGAATQADRYEAPPSPPEESTSRLDFVASISHELRTPLSAIIGAAHLAEETEDPARVRELVGAIRAASESLADILDDAGDLSRLVFGHYALECRELDLYALVGELARIHGLDAMRKGLAFSCLIEPGTPRFVSSDPRCLRQAIAHLLGNAVKFTPAGEVVMKVGAEPYPNGHRLRIEVRDTGVGISASHQKKLFSAFEPGDASPSRSFYGTGMGLAITQRLMQLLGGTVRVSSAPGQGAVFTLDFSIVPLQAWSPPSEWKGRRVGIVESCPLQREALASILRHFAIEPVLLAAPEAAETLAPASEQNPLFALLVESECESGGGFPLAVRVLRPTGRSHTQTGSALLKPLVFEDVEILLRELSDGGARVRARHAPLSAESRRRRGLKVLLAEDSKVSREILSSVLERAGFGVDAVGDGQAAVDAFQNVRRRYDIVLMDIQMPVMDGFEAAEAIRACEERRTWVGQDGGACALNVPILALTADVFLGIEQRCAESGMNGVLIKPSTPQKLISALDEAIRAARGGDDTPACSVEPGTTNTAETGRRSLVEDSVGAVLNLEVPMAWVGQDAAEVRRLARSFLAELPANRAELEAALGARPANFAAARRSLHRFKSALRIMGAVEASALLEPLHTACRDGDPARARAALAAWSASLSRLQEALSAL